MKFDFSNDISKKLGVHKYVIAAISYNEFKDDLLKNKYMRHSMNRTQNNRTHCPVLMTKDI